MAFNGVMLAVDLSGVGALAKGAGSLAVKGVSAGVKSLAKSGVKETAEAAARKGVALAKNSLDNVGASLMDDAAQGAGKARIPYNTGNLPEGVLGVTDRFGNITVSSTLTGKQLAETVAHEGVHSFFSPANTGAINRLRATIGEGAYVNSSLVRYIEEALAEGVATRSVISGITFPITHGYVTVGGVILEGGAFGGAVGIASYMANQTGNWLFE